MEFNFNVQKLQDNSRKNFFKVGNPIFIVIRNKMKPEIKGICKSNKIMILGYYL